MVNMNDQGKYFALAQCGFEMVAPMILGIYLDKWLNTTPWFTLGSIVLGFVGGIAHMVILSNQIQKDEKRKKK